jgi:arginine decarboxylase
MEPIRIVWGTGAGPTALAAYDAALAEANVHEFNLLRLSSVIPPHATIERAGTAPALGTVGDRLSVVEASATTRSGEASAALGWARRANGSGIFYEDEGEAAPETVIDRLADGLAAGVDLRSGSFEEPDVQTISVDVDDVDDTYASVAVLAVYGTGDPVLS